MRFHRFFFSAIIVITSFAVNSSAQDASDNQESPPPTHFGIFADSGGSFQIGAISLKTNPLDVNTVPMPPDQAVMDMEVDYANQRLYVLSDIPNQLHIFRIDINEQNPNSAPTMSLIVPDEPTAEKLSKIKGSTLCLVPDARRLFVADDKTLKLYNLYTEYATSKRDEQVAFSELDAYEVEETIVAMEMHPNGEHLFYITEERMGKLRLRGDVLDDVKLEPIKTNQDEAGLRFADQLDLEAFGLNRNITDLAISPDGNFALITAKGQLRDDVARYSGPPPFDEGSSGVFVVDLNNMAFLGEPIPTTLRNEKVEEIRREIFVQSQRIKHPSVGLSRLLADIANTAASVPVPLGLNPYTTSALEANAAADIFANVYRWWGFVHAYNQLYPQNMVSPMGVDINDQGNIGLVVMNDTNNMGIMNLQLSDELLGYNQSLLPDFAFDDATNQHTINTMMNDFDQPLFTDRAYFPRSIEFTPDGNYAFLGTAAGGGPYHVNLQQLRNQIEDPFNSNEAIGQQRLESIFKLPNTGLTRTFEATTLQGYDADYDTVSNQVEALNRWNELKNLTIGQDIKVVSTTSSSFVSNPSKIYNVEPDPSDPGSTALSKAFELSNQTLFIQPNSGVGYRMNHQSEKEYSTNFALGCTSYGIESIGQQWNKYYIDNLDFQMGLTAQPEIQVTRPYIIVSQIASAQSQELTTSNAETLSLGIRDGSEANIPYLKIDSDEPHDFVLSNSNRNPTDNSKTTSDGFDAEYTRALLEIMLKNPHVSTIALDPQLEIELPEINFDDPKFILRGSLEEPESRRDADSFMVVTFSCTIANITIDSNNDGIVDAADDAVENIESFLFWANDDNNENKKANKHQVNAPTSDPPVSWLNSDWNTRPSIDGVWDLIDFSPMRISVNPSPTWTYLKESGHKLIIRSENVRYFQSSEEWTQNGLLSNEGSYLLDKNIAEQQIDAELYGGYNVESLNTDAAIEWTDFDKKGNIWVIFECNLDAGNDAPKTADIELILLDPQDNEIATLDKVSLDIRRVKNMFETRSVRGSQNPSTYDTERLDDNDPLRFTSVDQYPTFPTLSFGEFHNPDSTETLIFIHGFNVTESAANVTFQNVFKKLYRLGYRDNFVGLTWDGAQFEGGLDEIAAFDADMENAFESSLGLIAYIDSLNDTNQVNVMAHSLGNMVIVDALRRLALTHGNAPQINNLIHVEAAVWENVYAPRPTDLRHREIEQKSTWRHWAADVPHTVSSKIINSYNWSDVAVNAQWMGEEAKIAIKAKVGLIEVQLYRQTSGALTQAGYEEWALDQPFRTPNRLAYRIPREDRPFKRATTRSLGIKAVPYNFITNINARSYGWRAREHSDYQELTVQDIWRWYKAVGYLSLE